MKSVISFLFALTLLAPAAAAQDADVQAQTEEAHERYAELWAAGDVDGLLTMFAEDAIFWPVTGGQFQGREEIREAMEAEPTPTSAAIEGSHLERMNGIILDVGTFTVEMPEEAGGEMQGEYVALLAETENGILIQRLIGFPLRQPPPVDQ